MCYVFVDIPIVLITGSAGFIGFHTALRLIETGDAQITAVDSFNDHYDVNLKKARAAVLQEKGTLNIYNSPAFLTGILINALIVCLKNVWYSEREASCL